MTLNNDLSNYSAPLTEDIWCLINEASCELGADAQQHFFEKGYAVGPARLGHDVITELLADLDHLMQPGHPGNHLWHEYHTSESTNPDTILFHAIARKQWDELRPTLNLPATKAPKDDAE